MLVKIEEAAEILERDELEALRFASRYPKCLGPYRDRIQRAWAAHTNPAFYRELGDDPSTLVADGLAALRELIARG